MKDIKKLTDMNSTPEEVENIMEKLISQKFDQEKIDKYQEILSKKYGIERSPAEQDQKPSTGKIRYLYLIASSIAAIAVFFLFFKTTADSNSQNYSQYVQANPVQVNIDRGGNNEHDDDFKNATIAFENEKYDEAIQLYKSSTNKPKSSTFYLAYSLMRTHKYNEAKNAFSSFISKTEKTEALYAEAKVFEIINLLLFEKIEEAEIKYNLLTKDSWEEKEMAPFFNTK